MTFRTPTELRNTSATFERFFAALERLQERLKSSTIPLLTMQLGSGWDQFLKDPAFEPGWQSGETSVSFEELGLPMPDPTINHKGELQFVRLNGKPIVIINGRLHRYDLEADQKTLSLALLWLCLQLGCENFVLTNAAGATRPEDQVGELIGIRDHVTWGFDALNGVPRGLFSPLKFNGMNDVYTPAMLELFQGACAANGAKFKTGVYFQVDGPCYETPALVRCLKNNGADLIGMSTGHEAGALHSAGAKVTGISCVTNPAAEEGKPAPSHVEVMEALINARPIFQAQLLHFVGSILKV